jgi:cell shape-determining protein MreC
MDEFDRIAYDIIRTAKTLNDQEKKITEPQEVPIESLSKEQILLEYQELKREIMRLKSLQSPSTS